MKEKNRKRERKLATVVQVVLQIYCQNSRSVLKKKKKKKKRKKTDAVIWTIILLCYITIIDSCMNHTMEVTLVHWNDYSQFYSYNTANVTYWICRANKFSECLSHI